MRYIVLKTFSENVNLCPVTAVRSYIHRTSVIRTSQKLFVTTQSPFQAASTMTVRRWVLTALFQAGIDVNRYSAKTTRHASSSKAYFVGVSLDTVMNRAGWQNVSSFVIHYNLLISVPAAKKDSVSTLRPAFLTQSRRKRQWFKTSHNLSASRVLQKYRTHLYKKTVQFQNKPFAKPPKPVKKVTLRNKVRVQVQGATCVHSNARRIQFKKRPYVVYTDVVPSTSGSSTISVKKEIKQEDPDSLSSTE